MAEKYADLHTHSYYSDGTMSPEELLSEALKNDVGLLAVTDHDNIEGTLRLQELCKRYEIGYLSGVELDSLDQGSNIHVLGYGVDLTNQEFVNFVNRNWSMLNAVNSMLIEKMQADYSNLSMEDYLEYRYDRTKGGWKALHYLMDQGIISHLREGFPYYIKYECTYDKVDFLSVGEVCEYIHKAGGKAVLAHPGVSIKEPDLHLFEKELRRLINCGADGLECYYATHSKEITDICLSICNEQDLLITCGSDCHGSFGSAQVGQTRTPISKLKLNGMPGMLKFIP